MSLGETYVTVQGWVGSEPDFKEIGGQTAHATFRVASTPRQFNRSNGTYIDKPTTWFSVECWRALAQNTFDSVHVGQPVIVTGRLRTHQWTDEAGELHSRVVLEAFSVGHDLTRGTTTFTKSSPRQAGVDGAATSGAAEMSGVAETSGALAVVPSAGSAEATASPYPADEFTTTPLPLTPTTRESEAA
jgi:single-strand DNA-binding protein